MGWGRRDQRVVAANTWPLASGWPCECLWLMWDQHPSWFHLVTSSPAWMEQATWFNVSGQLGQWSAKGLQNLKPAPYLATMASFSIWFVTASINNSRSRVSSWWIYDQISPGLLLNVCRALSLCWAPYVPGHCNVCCVCSSSSSFLALSLSFWGFSVWVWFGFILPFVFQTWGFLYWSSLTVVLRLLFV